VATEMCLFLSDKIWNRYFFVQFLLYGYRFIDNYQKVPAKLKNINIVGIVIVMIGLKFANKI
jgi:hypothetical protein